VTNLTLVNIISLLSADHQGGGCETDLVDGGDELAGLDRNAAQQVWWLRRNFLGRLLGYGCMPDTSGGRPVRHCDLWRFW
jgi:hypothetical protein